MQLHYESATAEGGVEVKVIEFGFCLPSPHARVEFRKAQAELVKANEVIQKRAKKFDDERNEIVAALAKADSPKVKADCEKALVKNDGILDAFTAEIDETADKFLFKQLRACADSTTSVQLTDEVVGACDLSEVRSIVTTFRERLGV